ncbi:hypothetical protein RI129_000163 [Pyrocoelia pectoralis]|uniref:Uncharacterized protein n=1 Tax=Pyrocoelia pectoralis TaxID=417401 RepID=A0AAN7V5J7_9COLE
MRPDEISLVAKKDHLICAFGSRYLKIHREKHFINVVSRKMRELSRLLIETRKVDPSIKSLFDVLKPEKYDILINATKTVAKYDCEKEFYASPTFAINMGTNLKQCCEIAIMNVLKKKEVFSTTSSNHTENSLQTLIKLIESHWKFDISSQASNDLNLKKWNKVSLLPLADDLKLLKDFLVSTGNDAQRKLEGENPDANSYLTLLETIYCRTILLNRRRPGELQRLLLRTYNLEISVQNYEEFEEVLSTTEKVLIKNFKRIVIRGKRGRGVPVLFSTDVQNHLDTLIKVRDKFVSQLNLYLFGNPGTTQPIHGYKILKKYAVKCGARNPDAITCTKLRKHLATLTQLFNMSENDMEQLATFMGHTLSVHRQNYRLPDDVYQTAKISKLLMLMEKGEAGQFKGKSLDDIRIDLNEDLLCTNENNKDNERNELDDANIQGDNEDDLPISETVDVEQEGNSDKMTAEVLENIAKKTVTKPKKICTEEKEAETDLNEKPNKCGKKRILVPWTEKQKLIVTKYFSKHIKSRQPPKRFECEELIEKNQDILHNKNWLKIKVFVQNIYTKK